MGGRIPRGPTTISDSPHLSSLAPMPTAGDVSTARAIREIIGTHWRRVVAFCGSTFIAGFLEALFLVLVTRAAVAIADGENTVKVTDGRVWSIGSAVALGAVVLAARLALSVVSVRMQSGLTYRVTTDLRSELGAAFLRADRSVQARQPSGALQQLVVQFPASTSSLVFQLSNAMAGGLGLLALLIIALLIDVTSTLVLFGAVIVLALVLSPIRRSVRRRSRQAVQFQIDFANRVAEMSDLSLEVNAFGVTEPAVERLDQLVEREGRASRRVSMLSGLVAPVYMTLAYCAILVALWILSDMSSDNFGSVGSVMLIMLRSLTYGQQLQHGATAISQFSPFVERIIDTRRTFHDAVRGSGTREISGFDSLVVRNIDFHYDDTPVLRDASFGIERGQIVGVVGPSGSGKTTLIQVMLGLLHPTTGSIQVDGVDLAEIRTDTWHRLVAYVPQDSRLIAGTVADNVRFLRAGVSDADIERALASANLTLDSGRFPLGMHTDLQTAGRELSGGQRQRLAIARALATDPSLLVLDEPTSSLDAESEEVIVETLARLRGKVATVVVTHRDSTLHVCDRIVAVEGQRVVERRPAD